MCHEPHRDFLETYTDWALTHSTGSLVSLKGTEVAHKSAGAGVLEGRRAPGKGAGLVTAHGICPMSTRAGLSSHPLVWDRVESPHAQTGLMTTSIILPQSLPLHGRKTVKDGVAEAESHRRRGIKWSGEAKGRIFLLTLSLRKPWELPKYSSHREGERSV